MGFVTTFPQLIFAIQDNDVKGNLKNTLTNTGIDLGGVIGGIFLWINEVKDENKKLERFTEAEMKLSNRFTTGQGTDRESKLSKLPIEIQFSLTNENTTKIVSFKDIQEKGQQNVIILAGSSTFIKDALISARIEGNDFFNTENIVIVPVVLKSSHSSEMSSSTAAMSSDIKDSTETTSATKGFGIKKDGDATMTAPYIAKPAQLSVWERDMSEEVEAAKKQGTADIVEKGLVLVVSLLNYVKIYYYFLLRFFYIYFCHNLAMV